MVRLTNSEVDCVINAARPLDGSARDAFLREVASALASCAGILPALRCVPRGCLVVITLQTKEDPGARRARVFHRMGEGLGGWGHATRR